MKQGEMSIPHEGVIRTRELISSLDPVPTSLFLVRGG
jgi:hypothetical protein